MQKDTKSSQSKNIFFSILFVAVSFQKFKPCWKHTFFRGQNYDNNWIWTRVLRCRRRPLCPLCHITCQFNGKLTCLYVQLNLFKLKCLHCKLMINDSTFGRAVDSNTRGPGFKSSHQHCWKECKLIKRGTV